MNQKRLELKVGLFVLIGLAGIAGLMLKFSKGAALFRPTYALQLTAKNVGGLKPRAAVLMAGVGTPSSTPWTMARRQAAW